MPEPVTGSRSARTTDRARATLLGQQGVIVLHGDLVLAPQPVGPAPFRRQIPPTMLRGARVAAEACISASVRNVCAAEVTTALLARVVPPIQRTLLAAC